MPDAVIQTDRLTKVFGTTTAVREIHLDVARGSVYAFLGPNGAGKSTTIRLLLGLLRPTGGEVTLFGRSFPRHRREVLARIGSLVESPSVYPHLTARENLEIPRRILGAPLSDPTRVLQIVGLASVGRQPVRTFSLGMKQRLGLAHALLGARELLILDEPTNGLDPSGITEMRTLIRSLPAEHGVTVFLSSHLLSEVEHVATHVGILSQGAMVFQGPVAELSRQRRPRLRIRLDGAARALAMLESRGWPAHLADGELLVDSPAAAGAMNRALVEAGHEVTHLAVESATLEEVFLEMTHAGAS
jgi:ABC-type multidrug transport system ATPase subunit